MSTITGEYAATHSALMVVARAVGLAPAHVRVLIALAERNRSARSDDLERDLGVDSSALRRSLLTVYKRGLCAGAPRKRGTRTTVTLTDAGNAIVEMALAHRRSLLESRTEDLDGSGGGDRAAAANTARQPSGQPLGDLVSQPSGWGRRPRRDRGENQMSGASVEQLEQQRLRRSGG
jgi:DNA-binding MarR family transcriptional regulator